ncbi:MAG: DUF4082 domain-containing protein [Planctomycetes bacterium]|nr:DUF4082 domain-containing protein [Planctomycetota bacterium]
MLVAARHPTALEALSCSLFAFACATLLPAQNPIVLENLNPGTPAAVWYEPMPGASHIQGFATDFSVDRGETVRFKIDTDATAYHIDVYRLGWYGGDGARLVGAGVVTATLPQTQPAPLFDPATAMTDCGNWAESAHWDVPPTAVSGVYYALLTRDDATPGRSHVLFVVRDDASTSDVLMSTSDSTWNAYNLYGGASLYPAGGAAPGFNHATKASYNRPLDIRHADGSPGDDLFQAEYAMLRWLERNGYDVTYTTSVDTARRGNLIQQHQLFVMVGHDEYWSAEMRNHVTAARDAGVHLGFFSGNEVYWKVRWEPSIDGTATPWRTMVCYKEGSLGENGCGTKCDPSVEWTGLWRDGCAPGYAPNDACLPENALTGQISWQGSFGIIEVPDDFKDLRFWRNTSVASLLPGQTAQLSDQSLGAEWDPEQPAFAAFYPPRRIKLSRTVLGGLTHHLSLYRADSGALVFGAGTMQWSWGLDDFHTFATVATNADMQQATVNLFADMGVAPGSLQAGLVPATGSSDTQAPGSAIAAPIDGGSVPQSSTVIVQGVATDAGGGVVAGVEVSTDGGTTWLPAAGGANWTFLWSPSAQGTFVVKSRAFDDTGNLEVAGAPGDVNVITLTVTAPDCPCTVFANAQAPTTGVANDGQPIELGMKFRADVDGHVTALRYYKPVGATGTRTGHLWTAAGALLAEQVFTGETASGWQQVVLPAPVAVTAGTTYVVSYFSASGDYVATNSGFSQAWGNGFVHGLANGTDGGNGVYVYTPTGAFPTQTFQANNYWVDVVFDDAFADTTPPAVTARVPGPGAIGVPIDTILTATFAEALAASTVTAATFELRDALDQPVPATVFYDAVLHRATLVPNGWLAPLATYTAILRGDPGSPRIEDLAGNALAGDVAWTFATAATAAQTHTVFARTDVPAAGVFNDNQPTVGMELGMRFRVDEDGYVTRLRYYKPAGATGLHTGHLWTGAGALLATQDFTGETASGWQEVALTAPVPVAAGTTYVVSYFSASGDYASTANWFTAMTGSGLVHGLADGFDGTNGLYLYTAAPAFPTQGFNRSNYWADVVFVTATGPDVTPPVVTGRVPAPNATGVPVATAVAITFSEALDALSVDATTIELLDPLALPVPATVGYDNGTLTALLTPAAPLALSTTYTVVVHGGASPPRVADVAGNPLAADVTWTFTTEAPAPPSFTVFPPAAAPVQPVGNDGQPIEVGMRFRADVDGTVTALRYYKPVGATGVHTGSLYTGAGALLARQPFTAETASGWQELALTTPVPVVAGTTYVVAYHSASGDYVGTPGYFVQQAGNGLVHGLADGQDGPNGVYAYTATPAFPTQTFQQANYWADVRFVPDTADVTPPVITARVPAPGATAVPTNAPIVITWSEALDASTVNGATITLLDAFAAPVPTVVDYTTGALVVTVEPTAWLAPNATYTVVVRGGASAPRVQDPSGNALAADESWSFTTGAAPLGPFTLFDAGDAPAGPRFNDGQPTVGMELGMRFRADVDGFVTGFRFYKAPGTTGTHTGHLWTNGGALLAAQEFTAETASGWQQVGLATPVPITAGTTYVVSYFAASGDYVATLGVFTQPLDNGVLHGLADGQDGANGVFAYTAAPQFPTSTFQSANYWADVVFDTASASLTTNTVGNGTVARAPDQPSYYPGSTVVLTATPAPGHVFDGWSGDATGTTNPLTVVVGADTVITAAFSAAPIAYVLDTNAVGGGSVARAPDLPLYLDGSIVLLTATPDANRTFVGWSGDVVGTTNPLAVLMDGDKTVTATFVPTPRRLAVTVVGGGTVARVPDLVDYPHGTLVELTATADVGWTFAGWSGAVGGTTNPVTIVMDADQAVTALFTLNSYPLAVNVAGAGSVVASPDLPSHPHGSVVQLTAVPDAGHVFAGWSGDATGLVNPLALVMDAAKNVTATFVPEVLPASNTPFGRGCYTLSNSFYRSFATAGVAATALSGQSITLVPSGASYVVTLGGGTFVPPSPGAATILAGIDDGAVTIAPSVPVPYPGGTTSTLTVHSNGIVAVAPLALPDVPDSRAPDVATLLAEATTAWYHWHDFAVGEGGAIRWEEQAGVLLVTWAGVESHPLSAVNPSTFQFQFDLNPGPTHGVVRLVWDDVTAIGGAAVDGRVDTTLVGFSPGGPSLDAGPLDFATDLPAATFVPEVPPLSLAIAPAPVSTPSTGSLVTYTVADIPEAGPGSGLYVAVVFLSFAPIPGGVDLGGLLGAPGCSGYVLTTDITIGVGPFTAATETGAFLFPAGLPYGLEVTAQAVALVVAGSLPNGQNPGGLLTSNAVRQFVSDF